MIYAVGLIIVVALILFIIIPRRALFSKSFVTDSSSFIEWVKETHEGESYNLTIVNEKAKTDSDSLEIKYNFSTQRGTLYDKALDIKYKIIFDDGKFYTLDR